MLGWALTFFVISIMAAAVGFGGSTGETAEIAQILWFVFFLLFLVALIIGRRTRSV